MKRFHKWIDSFLNPEQTNLRDGALEDIIQALDNPSIRRKWVQGLMTEIWESNIKLDRLMEAEKDDEWKKISMRRNSIVFCLNQILSTRDMLESELIEQDRQNKIFESYKGVSAPLDNRR